jgi:hypothetical protein
MRSRIQQKKQRKSRRQYGGLDADETKFCPTFEMFVNQLDEDYNLKGSFANINKNCETLDGDECAGLDYINSDEWYAYTDKLRGAYHNSGNLRPTFKAKMSEILEENEAIVEQIGKLEKLQQKKVVNDYLLKHIFNEEIFNTSDEAIFAHIIMFKNTMQNKYQLDCGVCDQKQNKMFHEVIESLTSEGDVKTNIAMIQNYCTQSGGNKHVRTKQSKKSLRRK